MINWAAREVFLARLSTIESGSMKFCRRLLAKPARPFSGEREIDSRLDGFNPCTKFRRTTNAH